MKTIIAATNFSEVSNHAVAFAADVAKTIKARLIIFNVIGLVPAMSDARLPLEACDATIEESDKLLKELFSKIKARVNNEIEVKILYKVGSVISELNALCQREKPFAIFIAAQFVTAFERFILGTYAVSIAKYSAFPVVVVPLSATMTGFKKMAIAIDFKLDSSVEWRFLRNWLKLFHPQVDIVYVTSDTTAPANKAAMTINVNAQLKGFGLRYYFLTNDNVVDGIKEYIVENKPDLLIMLVNKHRFFHKSVTKPFIEAPSVPVLFLSSKFKSNVMSSAFERPGPATDTSK
ncbi:universal stress protein [Niabella beijingensis]|uniref:universal stress protein n=1 Tax=Niabella beijingensis TaxID=2872700 RepID=UPI001CBF7D02|nr:universal stress protein [Niabella beijingensis]MBZ4191656.1 universal stress protein [Niabella beijingensis]